MNNWKFANLKVCFIRANQTVRLIRAFVYSFPIMSLGIRFNVAFLVFPPRSLHVLIGKNIFHLDERRPKKRSYPRVQCKKKIYHALRTIKQLLYIFN